MPRPSLAIVVVSYASVTLLRSNLRRSVGEIGPDLVVVVDCFSTWDERVALRALADEEGWELIEPRTNLGFGGGANRGVSFAVDRGMRDVLLLNPDAYIGADAVRALRSAVARSRLTLCAPRIVDSTGAVWFEGADVALTDGRTRGRTRQIGAADSWEWLTGACLLISDDLWVRTGGFDEDYFLYWEDVDFSRRVRRAGGALRVVAEATAVHDEGGTQHPTARGRAKSEGYYYYNIRNRMLFAAKHLDRPGVERWGRGVRASAREILLRGGRRQFLTPWRPVRAALRGIRDARRIARSSLRLGPPRSTHGRGHVGDVAAGRVTGEEK